MSISDSALGSVVAAAQHSLDVAANLRADSTEAHFLFTDFFHSRVQASPVRTLRCLLGSEEPSYVEELWLPPTWRQHTQATVRYATEELGKRGWQVRTAIGEISTAVIADQQLAVTPEGTSDVSTVEALVDHFDRIWREGQKTLEVLVDDIVLAPTRAGSEAILVASAAFWDDLITRLAKDPTSLHELEPRLFEQLITELLLRDGVDAMLTPRTKDGGYDILARRRDMLGDHLYLVECKRYGPHRPVGVGIVRALYGVVEEKRASGGILVTTSRFTTHAQHFRKGLEYRLSLEDYARLCTWLRERRASLPS